MNRAILSGLLSLGAALMAAGATAPLVVTSSPVNSPPDLAPQIDATAWVNQTTFRYFSGSLSPIPFQTLNTRFFTNRASGFMLSEPGFRFDFSTDNFRRPMSHWVNEGSIGVDNLFGLVLLSTVTLTQPGSWLLVSATNITSPGALTAGEIGLIRLEGENINLPRTPIRVGASDTNFLFFGGGFIGSSNYFNDPGVFDIYWGVGTNNQLGDMGQPLFLPAANFDLPFPSSPLHQVVQPDFFSGFIFTNSTIVPFFSFELYQAFVFTNRFSPTNIAIQVVFIPTNSFDTNLTTDVRFVPDGDDGATVVVGFHSTEFDIVTRQRRTNSIFLTDALAFETNLFLGRNLVNPTRRPSTYEVTRAQPFFFGGVTNNASFDPALIYNNTYLSNRVRVAYTGYSALITSSRNTTMLVGTNALSNPTNFPGRVEIRGKNVNLDRSRIRAESTVIIQAENLVSNLLGQVDAPFVNLDLGTVSPRLVVSNVAPASVRRVAGQLSAYSAIWDNVQVDVMSGVTNQLSFHVLIVDPAFQFDQPVIVNELALKGNLVRVEDTINVGSRFRLEGPSADIRGGLFLPASYSLGASNLINILNFTNNGVLSTPGAAVFGPDRTVPYDNVVNRGTNFAAAHLVRSHYVENTGLWGAQAGVLSLDADSILLAGPPVQLVTNVFTNLFVDFFTGQLITNLFTNVTVVGSALSSSADVELISGSLLVSNSFINAGVSGQPGALILGVTNAFSDGGAGSTNRWSATSGVQLRRRAQSGDLLHTRLTSVVAPFRISEHVWAGEDRGPVPEGFTNNQALGILTLDAGESSLAVFRGATDNEAMYVDYLELFNTATNFDDSAFVTVEPSLTIYFAHANVPAEKLDGAAGGRFVWVSDYAGPHSSTNLVYGPGTNVVANISLVLSKDLDSDEDHIPNFEDETPVFPPQAMALTVQYASTPGGGGAAQAMVSLSWTSLAHSHNYLECRDAIDSGSWTVLTNFVHGAVTGRVRFEDPVSRSMRVYRVRQIPRQ